MCIFLKYFFKPPCSLQEAPPQDSKYREKEKYENQTPAKITYFDIESNVRTCADILKVFFFCSQNFSLTILRKKKMQKKITKYV